MKNKSKISLMLFVLFAIAGALMFYLHYTAGAISGFIMATAAVPAIDEEVIANLKNMLSGFDLNDDKTLNALKVIIPSSLKNSNDDIVGKMDELINAYKNTLPKSGENAKQQKWYHSLLSDLENTSEDKDEKQRLGFNRYVRTIFQMHKQTASPEQIAKIASINSMLRQKHGLQDTNVSSEGGYAVPTPMLNVLLEELRESGLIFSELTQIKLTRRHVVAPTIGRAGHPHPSFKAESTSAAAKKYAVGNVVFGTVDFRVKDNGVIIPWTAEMDFDSIVDIGALIRSYVQKWFSIYGDDIMFRGNGLAGNDKITGLYELTASMQKQVMAGNTFGSVIADDFITSDGKMLSVDKKDMKRYMSPSVHALVKKLKDNQNRYIYDSAERIANMIEGKPVIETDSAYAVSESGANKAMVINANLKNGYLAMLNDVAIQVLQSNVAVWNDGVRDVNAFQENLTAIRLNLPFDIVHPFPDTYSVIMSAP